MEDQELKKATKVTRHRAITVAEILRGSEYALTLFSAKEVASLDLFDRNGKPYLMCLVTSKPRPAKPEEIVRQLYLRKLMDEYGYVRDRIALEKKVYFGSTQHEKAADIVIWEKGTTDTPYIIVECKKPKRKDGLGNLCTSSKSTISLYKVEGGWVKRCDR
jgi:type I restriction enzyme M protein